MFQEWGFLISEMVVLIILAALLGLFVGWLIWGRGAQVGVSQGDHDRVKADLQACRSQHAQKDDRIAALEAAGAASSAIGETAPIESSAEGLVDYDGDGIFEGKNEGSKPETLSAARGGVADDLKQIKGIGPKLEKLCNKLGFFHFDQIASWSADEVAWVDANLEGFKGRVSRDDWIAQAKVLSAGGETEFSKRVEGGGMY